MNNGLSPQTEQYLDAIVARGEYPSKAAALDAAVEALREKREPLPLVPPEDLERVERAIESAARGEALPLTRGDWDELRQRVRDAAARHG